MNLLDTILNASGGAVVQNMSKSLGLGEAQTQNALGQLLPAVQEPSVITALQAMA
jgi:hypothetical protein